MYNIRHKLTELFIKNRLDFINLQTKAKSASYRHGTERQYVFKKKIIKQYNNYVSAQRIGDDDPSRN